MANTWNDSVRHYIIRVVVIVLTCLVGARGQLRTSDQEPFQLGHVRGITELSLSPDAQRIATYSSTDRTLKIWDLASRRMLWSRQIVTVKAADKNRGRAVTALVWSVDSDMLVAGTSYGTLIALQAKSGRKLWQNEDCKPYVNVLAFNSTGDSVACGTAALPPHGSVVLLNSQSGRLIGSFRGSLGSQFWLNIDGKTSISAGEHGGLLRRWDIASGRLMAEKKLPWGCPSVPNPGDLAFSPDGRYIAFRCGATIQVLNTDSGNSAALFKMKFDFGPGMKFSFDGSRLAISDLDKFRVFDIGTGREVEVAQHSPTGQIIDLSRDGSLLVEGSSSGPPRITVSNTETDTVVASLMGHPGVVGAISFAPDGTEFAISGQDGVIRSFDVKTKLQKLQFSSPSMARTLAYSPDSTTLIVGCDDGSVYIVERETGSAKLVSREHEEAIQMISFNKRGDLVATGGGSTDRAIRIWRLSDWSLVRKIETPGETRTVGEAGLTAVLCCGSAVEGLAFTEDGTAITAALRNGAIYTWSIQTGAVLQMDTSRKSIRAASGLPGILAIAPGDGKRIQILESKTFTVRRTLAGSSGTITAIGVGGSGTVVAAGDYHGNTTIWAVRTGKKLGIYKGEGIVSAVCFSSDATSLIVGGEDQNAKLWNVSNGVLIFDLLNELGVAKQ